MSLSSRVTFREKIRYSFRMKVSSISMRVKVRILQVKAMDRNRVKQRTEEGSTFP